MIVNGRNGIFNTMSGTAISRVNNAISCSFIF